MPLPPKFYFTAMLVVMKQQGNDHKHTETQMLFKHTEIKQQH